MAKKPTTKRRAAAETETIKESIFDALAGAGAASMNGPGVQETKKETSDPEVTTAALLEQIGSLKAEIAQMGQTQTAILSQPSVDTRVDPPPVKAPEFPDPTIYPVEYAKAVAEYTVALQRHDADQRAHENKQRATQSNQYDQLFEDFAEAYPEYAEDDSRMEFVALKVADDAKRRGLDVNRYMFSNPSRFFKDVTKKYETIFGKPGEETDTETETDQDDGRSTSIFGGLESSPRGKPATPPAGDMVKDLQDVQRRLGLF